jgi:membrane protein
VTFVVTAIFFAWTMHFLLGGRVPWRFVVGPALVTALLWLALALLSPIYFSATVVDDSKTYGTIGVVFSFLTWFILIGGVIVLGAVLGVVLQRRTGLARTTASASRPDETDADSEAQADGEPETVLRERPPI